MGNFSDMHTLPALTILSGESETEEFETGGRGIAKVWVDDWNTAALTVQSQMEADGVFDGEFLEDGTEVGVPSATMLPDRNINLAPDGAGVGYPHKVKIRSGTSALAVNQNANRRVLVVVRGY